MKLREDEKRFYDEMIKAGWSKKDIMQVIANTRAKERLWGK
jgi:hypothetical protein